MQTHLAEHGSEAAAQRAELPEGLLEDGGEGEEAEGVACWGCIEDDDRVFHRLDVPVILQSDQANVMT